MADEAPQPDPPPSPEIRKARREAQRARFRQAPLTKKKASAGEIIVGTFCIAALLGVAGAIAIPGLYASQGARYSVRIEWQRRDAELDAAARQAREEGKLPPEATSRD